MNRNIHTAARSETANDGMGGSSSLFPKKGRTSTTEKRALAILLGVSLIALLVTLLALPLFASADLSDPEPLRVVSVTPRGTQVSVASDELTVVFNQTVDVVNLGTIRFGAANLNLSTASWSAGDTVLTVDLPSLDAGSVYGLLVQDFVSATGVAMLHGYSDQLVTQSDGLDIAITKRLSMPEDTEAPDTTFEFIVEPYCYNEDPLQAAMLPTLNVSNIEFFSTDTTTAAGGTLDIYRQSEYLLDGVTFDLPGYYGYRISERTTTFTDSALETMVFDTTVWHITFTVDWEPSPSTGTYVSAIDVQEVLEDDELGPKRELDDFTFTNFFVRTQDNEEPLVDSEGLSISKAVDGRLASRDLYFDFGVRVDAPAALSAHPGYRAYVIDVHTGEVITASDNGSIAGNTTYGDYLLFDTETTQTISLKHDQILVFAETHIGTRWNVIELATTDYIPSFTITRGGVTGAAVQGEVNTDLNTGEQQLIMGVNRADFVNELPTVPRTGLLIGSLHPLLVLIVVLGIITLLTSTYRRRKEKEVMGTVATVSFS